MTDIQTDKYKELLISPVRECANYTPKFGHSKSEGYSLSDFQQLYGNDVFYKWLGLDTPLMYSAHKAAGGITSVYRQIGIGCERLVRAIFMDYLGMSEEDVKWSYTISDANGKQRTLSLDGRIIIEKIQDNAAKERVIKWKNDVSRHLNLATQVGDAMTGIVFEVRQGYKSKDSKRQNADINNGARAYASGYIPCVMVMSAQIDDDNATRYSQSSLLVLQGILNLSPLESTFSFFKEIVGFDLAEFMNDNQGFFQQEINAILDRLISSE